MEWTIIDLKLIDAWSVLCLAKDDNIKTIEEIIEEVKVGEMSIPEKYKEEIGIRIANRRIETLPVTE